MLPVQSGGWTHTDYNPEGDESCVVWMFCGPNMTQHKEDTQLSAPYSECYDPGIIPPLRKHCVSVFVETFAHFWGCSLCSIVFHHIRCF